MLCEAFITGLGPCVQVLEAIFVFSCVWSLGACVIQRPGCDDRDR